MDADPASLDVASDVLRSAGYTAVPARSGRQALAILSRVPVDAVVLDLVMPGMDGFEVLRRIRALREFRDISIIALSGKQLTGEEIKILNSQATAFIQKGTSWKDSLLPELQRATQNLKGQREAHSDRG